MNPSREFKDSSKTTPGRDWRLPGNPLYGCLASSPWRDCSTVSHTSTGLLMWCQGRDPSCYAEPFILMLIKSAVQRNSLLNPISLCDASWAVVSWWHLLTSTALRGVIVAQGVSSSGKKIKNKKCKKRHCTKQTDISEKECGFVLGVPKWCIVNCVAERGVSFADAQMCSANNESNSN